MRFVASSASAAAAFELETIAPSEYRGLTEVVGGPQTPPFQTPTIGARERPRESDYVELRSRRLALGLYELGIGLDSEVVIACCDNHKTDREVALRACRMVNANIRTARLRVDLSSCLTAAAKPPVLLACAEGVEMWRELRIPARVIGDGLGVYWWAALEARHSVDASAHSY